MRSIAELAALPELVTMDVRDVHDPTVLSVDVTSIPGTSFIDGFRVPTRRQLSPETISFAVLWTVDPTSGDASGDSGSGDASEDAASGDPSGVSSMQGMTSMRSVLSLPSMLALLSMPLLPLELPPPPPPPQSDITIIIVASAVAAVTLVLGCIFFAIVCRRRHRVSDASTDNPQSKRTQPPPSLRIPSTILRPLPLPVPQSVVKPRAKMYSPVSQCAYVPSTVRLKL